MAPLRRRRRRGWRCSASGSGLAGSVESESGSAGAGAERPLAAEIFFWRAKICIEIGGKTTTRIFHVKVDMDDKESSHYLPPNLSHMLISRQICATCKGTLESMLISRQIYATWPRVGQSRDVHNRSSKAIH
jgi:hypothetical protein